MKDKEDALMGGSTETDKRILGRWIRGLGTWDLAWIPDQGTAVGSSACRSGSRWGPAGDRVERGRSWFVRSCRGEHLMVLVGYSEGSVNKIY